MKSGLAASIVVLVLIACRDHEPAATNLTKIEADGGVVDSIFPVEEEIRRFKAARDGAATTALDHASSSRDELVKRFMNALEARDTAAIAAMALSAAEFIDLYYPASIYSRPPYKQSPELLWFLMQQNSRKGIDRALDRYGGVPPQFGGYSCSADPVVWGENRFWEWCSVRWAPTPDAPSPLRLFAAIMERGGRFKFVSYANDL